MLSKRFYWFLDTFIPVLSFFGVQTYGWNLNSLTFVPLLNPQGKTSKRIRFNDFAFKLWFIFHLLQILRFYLQSNYDNLVFMIMFTFCMFAIATVSLLLIRWDDDFFLVLNQGILFLQHLHGKTSKISLL